MRRAWLCVAGVAAALWAALAIWWYGRRRPERVAVTERLAELECEAGEAQVQDTIDEVRLRIYEADVRAHDEVDHAAAAGLAGYLRSRGAGR